jgi:hypothetical protein
MLGMEERGGERVSGVIVRSTEIGVWSTEYHRLGFRFFSFYFHVDNLLFCFLLYFAILAILYYC